MRKKWIIEPSKGEFTRWRFIRSLCLVRRMMDNNSFPLEVRGGSSAFDTFRMIKKYFRLTLLLAFFSFTGCNKDDADHEEKEITDNEPTIPVRFLSFNFNKALNPELPQSVKGDIEDNRITIFLPESASDKNLIPTFIGEFEKAEVDGKVQISGVTAHDFDKTLTYVLTGKKGTVKTYEVTIRIFTGIPVVWLETEDKQEINSKEDYVNGTVKISATSVFPKGYEGSMRIRGRGNATWSYPKKPYRIKLDTKSEILGMPADKDWVLLAEYCDKSMLRNTYVFELSKLMDMPWTPRGHHVEVFLNGSYHGTYYLCEHVKVAKSRANIDDDGYLIEDDNYWNLEPLWFTTSKGLHFTFKHPDTDGMVEGDGNYNFIRGFMNEFESVLYSEQFADPNTGYRKYLDVKNFAKWYLLQETLGNIEPNLYYALKSRSGKLEMYPAWDFEWSLGLASMGNNGWVLPPATSPVNRLYHRNKYFSRLFQDPYFTEMVKQEWVKMKGQYLPVLTGIIDEKTKNIIYAQEKNFQRWQILGKYISVGLVRFDTWEEEVSYAKKFLEQRAQWLDSEISK